MKRTATILLCAAAVMPSITYAATPNRTATEAYVTNKIAAAVAAIPAPDFTTSNATLVATIEATAPAPGNYAAVSNAAMNAVQSETDPTVPQWAKASAKPSYSAAEVGAVSLNGGRMNYGATLSFGRDENGLDIDFGGIEISDEDDGRVESLYIDYNSITYTSPNGTQTLIFPLGASDFGATTPGVVTNIVRDLSLGGIWDESLQVWWTPRMRNGSLTYEATTNVNLNAEN